MCDWNQEEIGAERQNDIILEYPFDTGGIFWGFGNNSYQEIISSCP